MKSQDILVAVLAGLSLSIANGAELPSPLRDGLKDPNPAVQKTSLLALKQRPDGGLALADVLPLLDADDAELQRLALTVVETRPRWSEEVAPLLSAWLEKPEMSEQRERDLTGALFAFAETDPVERLVADMLTHGPRATRLQLLRVLGRLKIDSPDRSWLAAINNALSDPDLAVCREAIATTRMRDLRGGEQQLLILGQNEKLPSVLRLAALDALAARHRQLPQSAFAFLLTQLGDRSESLSRISAARALGASQLDARQLHELVHRLPMLEPTAGAMLVPAFARSHDEQFGLAVIKSLSGAPAADLLTIGDLSRLLAEFPAAVSPVASPLRHRLIERDRDRADQLAKLATQLPPGDAVRGRAVFTGPKAACASCHRIAGHGSGVGPNLSRVGFLRSPQELLESIIWPGAYVAPEFRLYTVATKDGRMLSGLLDRETGDALYLRGANLERWRISRENVEEIAWSGASLMPEGLENSLSRQELSDLVEYLSRLR